MINHMTPEMLSLIAMATALMLPLMLAMREFIIAAAGQAGRGKAVHLQPAPKARRGWTRIYWRDNSPMSGRTLGFIVRRALAIPSVGFRARYSMPDADAKAVHLPSGTFPMIELNADGQKKYRGIDGAENHGRADGVCQGCGDDMWAADPGWIGLPAGYGFLCCLCKVSRRRDFPAGRGWSRADCSPEDLAIPAPVRLSMPDCWTQAEEEDLSVTCKVGEISADESLLRRVFGEPHYEGAEASADGKVDLLWQFKTGAGELVTIYDYKGFEWSIGGDGEATVTMNAVAAVLDAAKIKYERAASVGGGGDFTRLVVSDDDGAAAARKAADEGAGGRPLPLGDVADQMRERARVAAAALKAEKNNDKRRAWETIRHEANNVLRSIREMEEAYGMTGADYPTARYSMPDAPAPLAGYKPTTMVDGTCRRGCLRGMSAYDLARVFGTSHYSGETMWAFMNEAGEVFTIYDYKGEQWSIGGYHNGRRGHGKNKVAVDMAHGILLAAGVDCRKRDMLLHGTPFEPVLYVGDLPELPCDAYAWAPEPAPDSPLVSVLKAIRALLVSGWNPPSHGFAINTSGAACHSRDKNKKTMCFAAAMSIAEARERRGTAEERDGRYKAIFQAVHKGADLAPLPDDAPTSALTSAIDEWENTEGRTQGDILYALDGAIAFVEQREGARFSMPEVETAAAATTAPVMPALDLKKAVRDVDAAIKPLKWSIRRPLSGECLIERAERLVRELESEPAWTLAATIRQNIRNALDAYRRARKADSAACPRYSMSEAVSGVAPTKPGIFPGIEPAPAPSRRRIREDEHCSDRCHFPGLTALRRLLAVRPLVKIMNYVAPGEINGGYGGCTVAIRGKKQTGAIMPDYFNSVGEDKVWVSFFAHNRGVDEAKQPAWEEGELARLDADIYSFDTGCSRYNNAGREVTQYGISLMADIPEGGQRPIIKLPPMTATGRERERLIEDAAMERARWWAMNQRRLSLNDFADYVEEGRRIAAGQVPPAADVAAWQRGGVTVRFSMPPEDVKTLATCPKCGTDTAEGGTIMREIPGGGLADHCLQCGKAIRCHCNRDPQMEGTPPEPCERCGGWREIEGEIVADDDDAPPAFENVTEFRAQIFIVQPGQDDKKAKWCPLIFEPDNGIIERRGALVNKSDMAVLWREAERRAMTAAEAWAPGTPWRVLLKLEQRVVSGVGGKPAEAAGPVRLSMPEASPNAADVLWGAAAVMKRAGKNIDGTAGGFVAMQFAAFPKMHMVEPGRTRPMYEVGGAHYQALQAAQRAFNEEAGGDAWELDAKKSGSEKWEVVQMLRNAAKRENSQNVNRRVLSVILDGAADVIERRGECILHEGAKQGIRIARERQGMGAEWDLLALKALRIAVDTNDIDRWNLLDRPPTDYADALRGAAKLVRRGDVDISSSVTPRYSMPAAPTEYGTAIWRAHKDRCAQVEALKYLLPSEAKEARRKPLSEKLAGATKELHLLRKAQAILSGQPGMIYAPHNHEIAWKWNEDGEMCEFKMPCAECFAADDERGAKLRGEDGNSEVFGIWTTTDPMFCGMEHSGQDAYFWEKYTLVGGYPQALCDANNIRDGKTTAFQIRLAKEKPGKEEYATPWQVKHSRKRFPREIIDDEGNMMRFPHYPIMQAATPHGAELYSRELRRFIAAVRVEKSIQASPRLSVPERDPDYEAAVSVLMGEYTAELAGPEKVLAGLDAYPDLVKTFGGGAVEAARRDARIEIELAEQREAAARKPVRLSMPEPKSEWISETRLKNIALVLARKGGEWSILVAEIVSRPGQKQRAGVLTRGRTEENTRAIWKKVCAEMRTLSPRIRYMDAAAHISKAAAPDLAARFSMPEQPQSGGRVLIAHMGAIKLISGWEPIGALTPMTNRWDRAKWFDLGTAKTIKRCLAHAGEEVKFFGAVEEWKAARDEARQQRKSHLKALGGLSADEIPVATKARRTAFDAGKNIAAQNKAVRDAVFAFREEKRKRHEEQRSKCFFGASLRNPPRLSMPEPPAPAPADGPEVFRFVIEEMSCMAPFMSGSFADLTECVDSACGFIKDDAEMMNRAYRTQDGGRAGRPLPSVHFLRFFGPKAGGRMCERIPSEADLPEGNTIGAKLWGAWCEGGGLVGEYIGDFKPAAEGVRVHYSMPEPMPNHFEAHTIFQAEVYYCPDVFVDDADNKISANADAKPWKRKRWTVVSQHEIWGKMPQGERLRLWRAAEDKAQGKAAAVGMGTPWRVIEVAKKRVASGTIQPRGGGYAMPKSSAGCRAVIPALLFFCVFLVAATPAHDAPGDQPIQIHTSLHMGACHSEAVRDYSDCSYRAGAEYGAMLITGAALAGITVDAPSFRRRLSEFRETETGREIELETDEKFALCAKAFRLDLDFCANTAKQ